MTAQAFGAIGRRQVILQHPVDLETFFHRFMQCCIRNELPVRLSGKTEGKAPRLVMLLAVERRLQLQDAVINDQLVVSEFLGFVDHPGQRNVRQPAFVFRIAAADVRVVAGEPYLLEVADGSSLTASRTRTPSTRFR